MNLIIQICQKPGAHSIPLLCKRCGIAVASESTAVILAAIRLG
ncbi:MAG TPA: hypothetical protein VGG34_09750 [Opitutaceae bacterium]|jgi:hypothetical protein